MLFKKAGAKHFVHPLLRIGLYCIKSFIIYYLLLKLRINNFFREGFENEKLIINV